MPAKPFSLRLMKFILATWWWLMIVGAVVFIGFLLVGSPDSVEFTIQGYASDIDTSSFSVKDRRGNNLAFEFPRSVPVKLVMHDTASQGSFGVGYRLFTALLVFPFLVVAMFFVKQLRDIVKTIDENNPFADENAGRIRTIGVLIFAFEVLLSIGKFAVSGFADTIARPEGFSLDGHLEFNGILFAVALAMIVLSEVFRHGARMREEQSLTV